MSAAQLMEMIAAYRVSRAIHAGAALGIADLLADGARTADEIAPAAACNPDSLGRLMRALASVGVLSEEEGGRFALTETGALLRTGHPQSLHAWAMLHSRPYFWISWSALEQSIRTGENAFRHVYGTSVWDYRAAHPDESAVFDRAMQAGTLQTNRAVLDAVDFGRFRTIVDVGGGNGALLAAILAANPDVRGILFDQAHVVRPDLLETAGVVGRCRIVGGSFFESVPDGGDAYILKFILHDWEDAEAQAILAACRRAMAPGTTLLVLERHTDGAELRFADLHMLVSPGGRERTLDEFQTLLAAAGFRFVGTTPTASIVSVIEAVANG
jgi:hypothetical protein